jgi:hypothetical protein
MNNEITASSDEDRSYIDDRIREFNYFFTGGEFTSLAQHCKVGFGKSSKNSVANEKIQENKL